MLPSAVLCVYSSCISFKFAYGDGRHMHQAYLDRQRTENVAQISDHLAKSAVWGLRSVIAAGGQMVYVEMCVCVCSIFNSFQLSALRFCVCVLPYPKCGTVGTVTGPGLRLRLSLGLGMLA